MVLANPTENSLDGDLHTVPTVHVNPPASAAIKAYAATSRSHGDPHPGQPELDHHPVPADRRVLLPGPSLGTGGDTLKPDLTAPGVATLAAVAPPSNAGRDFDFYSGTSMAAPHVAGLAALWFGAGVKPKWSPMKIKSALMTTAANLVDEDGNKVTDPYVQGAGRVRPNKMTDPGLVYPSGDADWLGYLEGIGYDTGTGVKAIDPSNYNTPSIAIGSLLKTQTVTRRVTAVKPGLYRVKASIPGVNVSVSPSILSFNAAGETRTFRVTFTNRSRRVRPGRQWLPDLEGCRHDGPDPAGRHPQGGRRPRHRRRLRRLGEHQVRRHAGSGRGVPDHRLRTGHRHGRRTGRSPPGRRPSSR